MPGAARTEELALAIRRSFVEDSDRLDLDAVCATADLRARRGKLAAARRGVEGRLQPSSSRDAFSIVVDPEPPGGWQRVPQDQRDSLARHRERFRVAHEAAHTLFYERRPKARPQRLARNSHAQEVFCDLLARYLLVPPPAVRALPVSASSVFALQDRFDVSLEVAARALASSHNALVALWFWLPGARARPASLVHQWDSLTSIALERVWRESDLVANALQDGAVQGQLPGERARPSTARSDKRRRQVIAVAPAG